MAGIEPPPVDSPASPSPASMEDAASECSTHPSFQCCICLDLLYKPVVLACGHMSCFWCVHKAMHAERVSQCPICRKPFYHFPSICWLLHFLLLKIEPLAYKRREEEVLEEEKHLDCFSPQVLDHVISDRACLEDVKGSSDGPKINDLPEIKFNSTTAKQVSLDDVICPLCKKLLFRPVVLNCGHVFCESCLSGLVDGPLKCQVCRSPHPGGIPNVCLDLDHFLEEQFPRHHITMKEGVGLERTQGQKGELSSGVPQAEKQTLKSSYNSGDGQLWFQGESSDVQIGVGCDSCGMYPIIGNRYRCKDCKEKIGFDLCEACYSTNSKFPGRFNQQHRPDHTFELDNSMLELYKKLMSQNHFI
ncbi:E3 ubiquitin-protein ligase PRT1 isoform X1 [Dioscorea cayenensis subsp. rotundata]|uniref:E3 ubiquitin-protein ligase PRT1 isoform X1 n=1 Tax=Dioscorea cayennensis subsp. rotundata TaxID=55577 RepID=A0AB40CG91_DIOCR|nr:E3 ubiquitin-protein ligase PRT1 isoform X1 [Dioscorea cayenensis subsp. rotundata]